MERMNLSFEIDGKTIAKMVMKERLETVSKRCTCIKNELEEKLETKVTYGASSDGSAKFNIYVNNHDYYSIYLNVNKNIDIDSIDYIVRNRIEELDFYKAPVVEKVIIDMLEENKCEDIYIFDKILCYGDLEFCLEDIKEFHVYQGEECLMRIWDELDGWYLIDFEKDVIEEELN